MAGALDTKFDVPGRLGSTGIECTLLESTWIKWNGGGGGGGGGGFQLIIKPPKLGFEP